MATKKKTSTSTAASTTKKKPAPKTSAKASAKTPAKAANKPATVTTSTKKSATTTKELAKLLEGLREAVEVKVPEENGIAVRLATRQLELPMLVHVGDLTVFDLYPFRFVGIDVKKVDWLKLVRLCREGYVQLGLDNDFEDADVLVYSFHMPLASLDAETLATVISTLCAFAEDHYDDVLQATGLVEKKRVH